MIQHKPASVTVDDALKAAEEWKANCGPGALAAVLDKTLDDVRPFLRGFDKKGYTNPTMMFQALCGLGVEYHDIQHHTTDAWPRNGLVRIQWHGRWMNPGVPVRARYRYTHWIASRSSAFGIPEMIFDINCVCVGWVPFSEWTDQVVPWLLKEMNSQGSDVYDGKWTTTHRLELAI